MQDLKALQEKYKNEMLEFYQKTKQARADDPQVIAVNTVATQPNYAANMQPNVQPNMQPSVQPNMQPNVQPNMQPSVQPNMQPSVQPNMQPSVQPNMQPNVQPNMQPNVQPNMQPNVQPNMQPSARPVIPQSSVIKMGENIYVNPKLLRDDAEFTPSIDIMNELKKIRNEDLSEGYEDLEGGQGVGGQEDEDITQLPINPEDYTGIGYLVVTATTANGLIPVKDATVIVDKQVMGEDGNINTILVDVALTDASGRTIGEIRLPTIRKDLTLTPGYVDPFSKYRVYVLAKGYQPKLLDDVYMFDGVESIQNVDLIPV